MDLYKESYPHNVESVWLRLASCAQKTSNKRQSPCFISTVGKFMCKSYTIWAGVEAILHKIAKQLSHLHFIATIDHYIPMFHQIAFHLVNEPPQVLQC